MLTLYGGPTAREVVGAENRNGGRGGGGVVHRSVLTWTRTVEKNVVRNVSM